MHRTASLLFSLLLLTVTAGYSQTTQNRADARPLEDPEIKTFVDGAAAGGLRGVFKGTGPFTFFVPSNAAVEKYGNTKFKTLQQPQHEDALVDLILFHIVPGEYHTDVLKPMTIKTISGKDLNITVENGEVRVNGAKIVRGNLDGPNGTVHIIDTVLTP